MYSLIDFFQDPILRAPTLGCMLMCLAASLIGVLVFVQKKTLVGETLSHATYPGIALAACLYTVLDEQGSMLLFLGAFLSASAGLYVLQKLQSVLRVKADAALCFTLSSFFGVGILVASYLQTAKPLLYRQIQVFLYGQVATLMESHVWMYAGLVFLLLLFLFVFYRPIQLVYFDGEWAKTLSFSLAWVRPLFSLCLILAVTVAIKSVGVVLLSGMLIAPALGARQFATTLKGMFLGAGCIGLASGFLGNYLSVELSIWQQANHLVFPTGPMIVLVSVFLALSSLLAAKWHKKRRRRVC